MFSKQCVCLILQGQFSQSVHGVPFDFFFFSEKLNHAHVSLQLCVATLK